MQSNAHVLVVIQCMWHKIVSVFQQALFHGEALVFCIKKMDASQIQTERVSQSFDTEDI